MLQISATELRKNLFEYLDKVEHGETVQVSLHDRVVANLVPDVDEADKALLELRAIAGQCVVGDVLNPIDEKWTGDADNL